jgi:hypothetical protein
MQETHVKMSWIQGKKKNLGQGMDYRHEDGSFPVSASCVTITNPTLLSTCKTGVDPGLRS